MLKRHLLLISVIVFSLIFVAREFFLHREIASLQTELSAQMTSRFSQATDLSRLSEISTAPVVYDSYLEPVLSTAQKLLWPLSRSSISAEWRRSVMSRLDELSFEQRKKIKTSVEEEISSIRVQESPSSTRLRNVMASRKKASCDPEFADLIDSELKLISQTALEKDKQLLDQVRSEGRERLKLLSKKMNQFDHEKLAHYLSSGNFHNEIEQPVLDLIVQIKSEETRRKTWDEFVESISKTLSKKMSQLSANAKRSQEISKAKEEAARLNDLIQSVARSVDAEMGPINVPEASSDIPLPTYENPAGIDYR